MKLKIFFISVTTILLTSFVLVYLFLIKPNKTFEFNKKDLISIELIKADKSIYIEDEQIEDFLNEFNKIKYKEKNKKVKTRGEYFIILTYEKDTYKIGMYYSYFNEEIKYTLFNKSFNKFINDWIKKNKQQKII